MKPALLISSLLALIGLFADPLLLSQLREPPFDYSQTFQPRARPTDAEPHEHDDPQPTISPEATILGPDDILLSPDESPEAEAPRVPFPPAVPPQPGQDAFRRWWPDDIEPEPQHDPEPPQPVRAIPEHQVVILSGCGFHERDYRGRFKSECIPCNLACEAAVRLAEQSAGVWTAGEEDWHHLRILDIDSPLGRRIDIELGQGGHSLTELRGHRRTGKYEPLTPVLVVNAPGAETQIIEGWHGGDPSKADALWYLSGLLGHRRDTPQRWGLAVDDGYDPLGLALAEWIKDEDRPRSQAWGATVPIGRLLHIALGEGRQEIAPDVWLTVPVNLGPYWKPGNRPTIGFKHPPFVEYKVAFVKRKKTLDRIEIAEDFSQLTLYASGFFATRFPVELDWNPY